MINELNQPEIKKILADNTLGRLGCISDGEPYVVPVYYHFDGESIYIHSLPGKKIEALRKHHGACLLVDEIEDPYRWRSVIAYGDYEEITDEQVRERKLLELFRRLPHLSPVESKMSKDDRNMLLFRLRLRQITGVREAW
jgi:nitroimidazol reductase NimA-like FMN-containing flavoprotein (pyridoxamine 5'-phosphate oxidase superfamily)